MPKVSVLMPVYKTKEVYLREAIESILNQIFTDFEFLILDDCPEDDRETIVKSYDDKRIKYVKNEKNLGISKSRNKLIDMAQGEYLAVFDHDDISLPQRFEKEVAYLDAHPGVGVVSCWVDLCGERRGLRFPARDEEIKIQLTSVCAMVHPASMIRKSVLDENHIRYEETYSPAEDYCLWIRLIPLTEFYNIQEVLFKYRRHETNATSRYPDTMSAATKRLQWMIRSQYPILFQSYLAERTIVSRVRLLGLPILKIEANQRKARYYLFDHIPFLEVSRKSPLWSQRGGEGGV